MEIERKWLLKKVPSVPADSLYWIEQFYVSTNPEIRLRRCMPHGNYENKVPYRLTIKGEGTLSRDEVETAVSERFYQDTLDMINLAPIQKHHLLYNVDNYIVEVSVVMIDDPFVYAEVEFATEQEAQDYKFPWPELVEREITEEKDFKMKNIWLRIHPY